MTRLHRPLLGSAARSLVDALNRSLLPLLAAALLVAGCGSSIEAVRVGDTALDRDGVAALVAEADGMADLLHLITTAQAFLSPGGWLALEHGYRQAPGVRKALKLAGYQSVESVQDMGGHERVTLGHLE